MPYHWLIYGVRERSDWERRTQFNGVTHEYFAVLWLPSYGYDYCIYRDDYSWQQIGIAWRGCSGFSVVRRECI